MLNYWLLLTDHEIGLEPRNAMKSEVECRSDVSPVQLESQCHTPSQTTFFKPKRQRETNEYYSSLNDI